MDCGCTCLLLDDAVLSDEWFAVGCGRTSKRAATPRRLTLTDEWVWGLHAGELTTVLDNAESPDRPPWMFGPPWRLGLPWTLSANLSDAAANNWLQSEPAALRLSSLLESFKHLQQYRDALYSIYIVIFLQNIQHDVQNIQHPMYSLIVLMCR